MWAEEPPKEEKKKDEVKLDAAEEVKLGRGMAFQGFAAEQQEAWRPAKICTRRHCSKLQRFRGFGCEGIL